ncbi:MAG: hypothetical protein K9H64_05380 [Bacteroidales bacterium]|nr:hypothetical protein [Bacteroidales bacterium]MCF8455271.1 hypothetical protein [Bacteroidales bacterium]
MEITQTTLSKIKRLEKFIAHQDKEDQVIDITINKILHREINKLQDQIAGFDHLLAHFNEKYDLDSKTFEQQFDSGELGDEIDFIEWSSTIEMKRKTEEYILNLQGK